MKGNRLKNHHSMSQIWTNCINRNCKSRLTERDIGALTITQSAHLWPNFNKNCMSWSSQAMGLWQDCVSKPALLSKEKNNSLLNNISSFFLDKSTFGDYKWMCSIQKVSNCYIWWRIWSQLMGVIRSNAEHGSLILEDASIHFDKQIPVVSGTINYLHGFQNHHI